MIKKNTQHIWTPEAIDRQKRVQKLCCFNMISRALNDIADLIQHQTVFRQICFTDLHIVITPVSRCVCVCGCGVVCVCVCVCVGVCMCVYVYVRPYVGGQLKFWLKNSPIQHLTFPVEGRKSRFFILDLDLHCNFKLFVTMEWDHCECCTT